MILKCKMCGGDIELSADKTFGTCDSCGSTMTFPKVDDEQRANMFNRGNHFRRQGEFDKALAVYERIVQEDENDAEAHWCCALCRFGIEYVEDPNTFEYLPTCHRASFDSFLEDVDYLAALEHSDGITRRQYQKDAAKIAEVQRGILATSQNEEPFDVFICYKESENDGSRTRDSIMAQEIYYQLTDQGRRVFFSRITLEDKAGTEYEPYIFAALNSAKVMILVTTSAEHANSVWVKNEWSRFLSLMRKDRSKLLLPCYRDMDPYDLPEALSVLQSYDMSKIGFIQDLIRGVNKVLDADKPKETVKETVVIQQQSNANAAPLLERAFMFLEDGDWNSANEYCEKVLDIDPKNAEAYLGKLMAELKVRKRGDLNNQPQPFDDRNNYQKAVRFGDEKLKQKLTADITFIQDRNETARKEGIYQNALAEMRKGTEQGYQKAEELLSGIPGYKDTDTLKTQCPALAETARKECIYQNALRLFRERSYVDAAAEFGKIQDYKDVKDKISESEKLAEEARKDRIYALAEKAAAVKSIESQQKAINTWKGIAGWRDADNRVADCEKKIAELKEKAEAERIEAKRKAEEDRIAAEQRKKKATITGIIIGAVAAIAVVIVVLAVTIFIPNANYSKAIALYEAGQYEDAISAFEALNGYKDSAEQIEACETAIKDRDYDAAVVLYNAGDYENAITAFEALNGYKDSAAQIEACETAIMEPRYEDALALYNAGQYEKAITAFEALNGYKDSVAQIERCNTAIRDGEYADALALYNAGQYEEAITAFEVLNGYKDSATQIELCNTAIKDRGYDSAVALYEAGRYAEAILALNSQYGYKQSTEYIAKCWDQIAVRNTIAAGKNHFVAVKTDGTVVAVGGGKDGQLDVSSWKNVIAVAAGSTHSVGLKSDGTVIATNYKGEYDRGQCDVSDWTDIVAISAGEGHTIGLKKDGTVIATAYKDEHDITAYKYRGQCDVSDWTEIIAISAGYNHTVGLKSDGTVVATGWNGSGQCNVSDWRDIVAITAGDNFTIGLKSNGTLVAAGTNAQGQCNVLEWQDIIEISTADSAMHTVGLKKDGTVVATEFITTSGYGYVGQCDVSNWSGIIAIAAGGYSTLGLKANGTVVAVGILSKDVSDWINIKVPNN